MARLGLLLAVVALVLAGCGQKGPLYRPEEDSQLRGPDRAAARSAPVHAETP